MNKKTDNTIMPQRIGQYRIIEILGKGGMGSIYKAVQEPLERQVAIKVLPQNLRGDEESAKRFDAEAKAVSLLQHQNIVSLFDYGEENGMKYFVMQYIEGRDLGKLLSKKKNIPVPEVINYTKQICRGLLYAHSKGVIHRDIKPQNILLNRKKVCHLSDFGIAKLFQRASITLTGMAVGTPEYMSPEQAQGEDLDEKTDIYSMGIVMYEMLTGKPPFTGNNAVSIAYKQVHEQPVPPSMYRKNTPKRLELIIIKALKKNKTNRYKSVEEMLKDLDTVNIDEVAQRPTVSFSLNKKNNKRKADKGAGRERRITDRRNRSVRGNDILNNFDLFSFEYWKELLVNQWLSLLLTAILFILFLFHLDKLH